MIHSLKARMGRREDEGFTLIELMVVVLIIAILMAIAIPTFLSARNTANARAAQSNLRNGITTEQTLFAANGVYSNSLSALQTAEPGLTWIGYVATATETPNTVTFLTDSLTAPTNLVLNSLGSDKNCYYQLDENGSVGYAASAATKSVCAATTKTTLWFDTWADATTVLKTPTSKVGQIALLTTNYPAAWVAPAA